MADEYIEKEAALMELCRGCSLHGISDSFFCGEPCPKYDRIISIPSADVVPVVRCKDCIHNLANIPDIQDGININDNWNACQLTELYDSVEPMDFCSHGAKREVDNG